MIERIVNRVSRESEEVTVPAGRILVVGILFLLFASLVMACQSEAATTPTLTQARTGYPNAHLLVDTAWLAERLEDPSLRIIDMRDPRDYNAGHVPGAVNIPVEAVTSTIDDVPLEFEPDEVQAALNQAGLTPDMPVVIYDDLGMMNAGRLFWTLEYAGHQDVRVLNGGWNAWAAEERVTTTDAPQLTPTVYPMQLDPSKIATAEQVQARLDDPRTVLLDARSPQEYTGEVKLADRGGHIPGAVNLAWLEVLEGGDAVYITNSNWQQELQDPDVEVFKSAAEIQDLLSGLGVSSDQEVITYCQTLWRGAHAYFMLRLMGFDQVRGYDGSWAEWGNRADLPVVTGPDPGSAP